jgi:hypothetical protein
MPVQFGWKVALKTISWSARNEILGTDAFIFQLTFCQIISGNGCYEASFSSFAKLNSLGLLPSGQSECGRKTLFMTSRSAGASYDYAQHHG